jgi:thiol-disulfide isomerase/thioredoxin
MTTQRRLQRTNLPSPRARRQALHALLALLATAPLLAPVPALASAEVGAVFSLRGVTLDGRAVDTEKLRGKVLMVFFWRTDCAVCLSKMPELRSNAVGWKGKPFELLLVNTDDKPDEAVRYENVMAQFQRDMRPLALWRGAPGYADGLGAAPSKLPLTLVIDRAGKVAARHEGRVPAEAWNTIADLMP